MTIRKTPAMPATRPDPTQQMQLPFWPDHLRGVPAAALYSALFAPIKKGARAAVQREQIAAVGEYRIVMTGFRFDQGDLDVLQQLMHLARNAPLGAVVEFRSRDMLRAIGRDTGKSQREWLLRSLSRMKACDVEICKGHLAFSGSLIANHGRDESTGQHYVILDVGLLRLFEQGYSPVRWQQRLQLAGKPLAQWLHGFIAGQQRPLTWKVGDLMRYAHSSYSRVRDFRDALNDAANEVRSVGDPIFLDWSERRDTVTIGRRTPVEGQSGREPAQEGA